LPFTEMRKTGEMQLLVKIPCLGPLYWPYLPFFPFFYSSSLIFFEETKRIFPSRSFHFALNSPLSQIFFAQIFRCEFGISEEENGRVATQRWWVRGGGSNKQWPWWIGREAAINLYVFYI
jgi:hypothetical protein